MNYPIEVKQASRNAWFTPAESNKYYKARYSREGITLHWWGGNEQEDKHDSIVNYILGQAAAGVKSANFVVSDAKITQLVDPDNVAWCSNAGNPTTISIECEPGLSDEGYKRLGFLIATLEKKYGHRMNLYPHSHWVTTQCPGSISLDRARRAAASAGTVAATTPASTPTPSPVPSPAATAPGVAKQVFLPSSAGPWRLYPEDKPPVVGNEKAKLRPDAFPPGLTYDIISWPQANTVLIQTQQYGRGKIWVGPETPAQFLGRPTKRSNPVPSSPGQKKLFLPGSVDRWRVYRPTGPWTVGNEIAFLRPALFGGLTYNILGNPAGNVYIIQTQDFGRVAIYAGPDTEARIK